MKTITDSRLHAQLPMWCLIVAAILCFSECALAQTDDFKHREYAITGYTGVSFGGDFSFATPVIGSSQESARTVGMHYSPGYQLGVRINDNYSDSWAADIEYSFSHQNLRFTNVSPSIPAISVNNYLHHASYNMTHLLAPPEKRFRPMIYAGVGAANYWINGESKSEAKLQGLRLRDSWEFLFNIGGGAEYLLLDKLAFTFKVRDSLTEMPSYGLPESVQVVNGQYVPGVTTRGIMQNWQIDAGAVFQWDDGRFRYKPRR